MFTVATDTILPSTAQKPVRFGTCCSQVMALFLGAVSHRSLQADRPGDVAGEIRKALKYIPSEQLIVSSDCGFGRQGCNREIAFYKATAIAQGCNIVRRELGLPTTYVPAAEARLLVDIVPSQKEVADAFVSGAPRGAA